MAHRSRLGVVCIDCQTGDLTEAMAFWSAVFGAEARLEEGGRYAAIEGQRGPRVELQAVDHAPRVHLDFETDDREAEAARLKRLGAREVARIRDWIVMEAPTGHRFCLVKPQGEDFPGDARRWEE
jgi:predicted enzyme related to lactoylglutathione lyase